MLLHLILTLHFLCMISIGLKDWFAKVKTFAKSMAQDMAQQQEVLLETSSQSSDL